MKAQQGHLLFGDATFRQPETADDRDIGSPRLPFEQRDFPGWPCATTVGSGMRGPLRTNRQTWANRFAAGGRAGLREEELPPEQFGIGSLRGRRSFRARQDGDERNRPTRLAPARGEPPSRIETRTSRARTSARFSFVSGYASHGQLDAAGGSWVEHQRRRVCLRQVEAPPFAVGFRSDAFRFAWRRGGCSGLLVLRVQASAGAMPAFVGFRNVNQIAADRRPFAARG